MSFSPAIKTSPYQQDLAGRRIAIVEFDQQQLADRCAARRSDCSRSKLACVPRQLPSRHLRQPVCPNQHPAGFFPLQIPATVAAILEAQIACPEPIARLLAVRHITDPQRFLNPTIDDLHPPDLMLGMAEAVGPHPGRR